MITVTQGWNTHAKINKKWTKALMTIAILLYIVFWQKLGKNGIEEMKNEPI